ncbi:unnamed protein product [marine sediment metagenome]|uniref:Uncharacterized protein n=1 Tax=marine sediment metagenome TaxID=412755 RepID=X1K0I9_9ZZZZ
MTNEEELNYLRRMSILFDPKGEKWTPEDDEPETKRIKKITITEYEDDD